MEQNTNALALNQLRPLENTDRGAIVEEHVRYWRKYKDDEEAEKLRKKAQEQEFARKKAEAEGKKTDKILEGLALDDSKGYLRDQIFTSFEADRPYLYELAVKSGKGDYEAKIKYDEKLAEYRELVSLDKIYQEQAKTLAEQDAKGEYNDALDFGIKTQFENLQNSNFAIKNGKLLVPNTDGEYEIKTPASFKNDLVFKTKYSGNFDTNEIGGQIADNIKMDDNNGNVRLSDSINREGIQKARNTLANNEYLMKTWAYKKGYKREELGNLNEVQITKLSETFYNEEVLPKLQQKNNSLSNALKNEDLKAKKEYNRGKKEANRTFITPSTDEAGVVLNETKLEIPYTFDKGDRVFNLGGKKLETTDGNVYHSMVRGEEGIKFIGTKIVKIKVPTLNPDGKQQKDSNGNVKFTIENKSVDFVETNEVVNNTLSRKIENEKTGKPLKNLDELDEYSYELLPSDQKGDKFKGSGNSQPLFN